MTQSSSQTPENSRPAQTLSLLHNGRELTRFDVPDRAVLCLGRAPNNDIVIPIASVSRRLGKLEAKGADICFTPNSNDKDDPTTALIPPNGPLELGLGLELCFSSHLDDAQTDPGISISSTEWTSEIRNLRRWRDVTFGLLILAILGIVGQVVFQETLRPKTPQELLAFVRPKILEFEFVKNDTLLKEAQAMAGLEDKDFLPNAGFCSGFLIAPEVMLTAFHCLRMDTITTIAQNFTLKGFDGGNYAPSEVLGFSPKLDYIFLRVPGTEHLGHLKIQGSFSVGQQAYTVGNVQGEGVAIREGIISSQTTDRNDPNVQFLRYSAAASPGNSGGPLINERGQVLALVFARSSAENYGYGIRGEDLKDAYSTYVKDASPKPLTFELKDLAMYAHGNPWQVFGELGLPVADAFRIHPEESRDILQTSFELMVPEPFDRFRGTYPKVVSAGIQDAYATVTKKMSEKNLLSLTWDDLPLNQIRLFLAPDYFHSGDFFEQAGRYVSRSMRISLPPQIQDWQVQVDNLLAKKNAMTVTSDYDVPIKSSETYHLEVKPITYSSRSPGKAYLNELTGRGQMIGFLDHSPGAQRLTKEALAEKIQEELLGKEGLLAHTYGFGTELTFFIRPQSHREFTLRSFPTPPTFSETTDDIGRKWRLIEFKILANVLRLYCRDVPHGQTCLIRMIQPTNTAHIDALIEENYRKHGLSQIYFHQPFWTVDSYLDNASIIDQERFLNDVTMSEDKTSGDQHFSFKTLGLEVSIPKAQRPDQIRFVGGLYKPEGADKPSWIALGLDGVTKEKGFAWKQCSVTLVMEGMESYGPLKEMIRRREETEDVNERKKILFQDFQTREGKSAKVLGFCFPEKAQPREENLIESDFEKMHPFTWKVQAAKAKATP